MNFGAQRQVRRSTSAPRIGCSTCGLRIPLEKVVALSDHRVLVCDRCHAIDLWQVGTPTSVAKGLDLLDEACRAIVQDSSRHRQ